MPHSQEPHQPRHTKARAPLPLPSQHDQIAGEMKVQEGSAQHGTCEQFGAHLGDLAKPKCPLDARLPTLKSLHTKANAETTAERRSKARPRRLRQALENRSQRTLTSSLSEATLPTIGDHVCKAHVSNDPGASPFGSRTLKNVVAQHVYSLDDQEQLPAVDIRPAESSARHHAAALFFTARHSETLIVDKAVASMRLASATGTTLAKPSASLPSRTRASACSSGRTRRAPNASTLPRQRHVRLISCAAHYRPASMRRE